MKPADSEVNPIDQLPVAPPDIRILVAEDNLINQKVAVRLLKHLGFQTECADNGRHALELLALKEFDLILMDIDMPEIDGLTTMSYIRDFMPHRSPYIVALSQIEGSLRVDACIEAGAHALIHKPLRSETVLAALHEAAGIRKMAA